jgi:nitroreductase
MLRDLVEKNRTCRRFFQSLPVGEDILRELVNLARFAPSAGNLQPLKYMLSFTPEKNALIFPHLRWAAYLPDWGGPAEGEQPSAYIIILGDIDIAQTFGCDHGIAAQTILLGAVERGFAGCILGSIDKSALKKTLTLPDNFEIVLVIALGKPKEKILIEPVCADGSIKYWRDKDGTHHVPKRSLDDLIVG